VITLYFSPSACSLASHISLREIGAAFKLIQVGLGSKRTEDGRDFMSINPKGYVPTIEFDGGQVMTENAAVLQYIADLKPDARLVPAAGTFERYRLQEWLSFVSSELHKVFTPFFDPGAAESSRTAARNKLVQRLTWLATEIASRSYLLGEQFTVADAYLFVIRRAAEAVGLELDTWPTLRSYHDRVQARPFVAEALKAESAVPALL